MQPLLINATLRYLEQRDGGQGDYLEGKGLIGAWALTYVGLAVREQSPYLLGEEEAQVLTFPAGFHIHLSVSELSIRHKIARGPHDHGLPSDSADNLGRVR